MSAMHRRLLSILAVVLILSMFIFPATASAAKFSRESGKMFVPRGTTQTYELQVGQVKVVIPAGAMPRGGLVMIHVITGPKGQFDAIFLPDQQFSKPVMIDFGTAPVVYYHNGNAVEEIVTEDIDGDKEVGEIWTTHFSRYSGWH